MGQTTRIAIPALQKPREALAEQATVAINANAGRQVTVFEEDAFQAMLTRERRRAERSSKPFILMLLDAHRENGLADKVLRQALAVVGAATRQPDLIGWYKQGGI